MAENNEKQVYEACGFCFSTKELADTALEEEKKTYFIRNKLNFKDMRSVLVIYNKMIKGNIFKTPVGMVFLKEIYEELKKDDSIPLEEIEGIPYDASYIDMDKTPGERFFRAQFPEEGEVKTYERQYSICKFVIALLILCVGVMFYITLKADNPNIINYETAIQNKYAAWEQEITEREKAVREKEQELGITGNE